LQETKHIQSRSTLTAEAYLAHERIKSRSMSAFRAGAHSEQEHIWIRGTLTIRSTGAEAHSEQKHAWEQEHTRSSSTTGAGALRAEAH
jgi:hypothetical protein